MANLNRVVLLGNLTADPELRYLANGTPAASFGLAVNTHLGTDEAGEAREETCFVDVTVFGGLAEPVIDCLSKGSPVFVEGRLRLERWEDGQGVKRSKLSVVAKSVDFLPGGDRDEDSGT